MNEKEIQNKLVKCPSYLKKGDYFLSQKFETTTEIIRQIRNKMKKENEQFTIKQIWQTPKGESILYVPKEDSIDYLETFKDFVSTFQVFETQPPLSYSGSPLKDLYGVVCLFDVHLGRITYNHYTNDSNDLKIQKEEFEKFYQGILNEIPIDRIKEFILPIGNDFFNVDNIYLQTTKGTPQSNTIDLHNTFKLGLELISNLVYRLNAHAPVRIIHVPGNHDRLTSNYFAIAIEQIFSNLSNVTVDSSPIERKYIKVGNTLLGLSHGELKPEQYADLLPFEAKELFGSCDFYEVLLGDKHHEKFFQKEVRGVTVRHLSGLTRKDTWTYKEGYTTSIRRGYSIFYHETDGRFLEKIHQIK